MTRLCAILILTISTTAHAEAVKLPVGGHLSFRSAEFGLDLYLDAVRFLIERSDIDYYNAVEKGMRQCIDALAACEDRECEAYAQSNESLLAWLGWPWVITGAILVAAAAATGAAILTYEATRPRGAP